MAKRRFTKNEARRQLVKRYLLLLLAEKKRDEEARGQTLEEITSSLAQDVAKWPEEDKKAAREELIWKAYPVKTKAIQ
jgi:hypothetical protein